MFQVPKYLFYQLYCWASRWKWDTTPQITAFIQISVLIWFNCFFIAEIAYFTLMGGPAPFSTSMVIASMAVVALPTYFLFLHNGKYKAIVEALRSESQQHKRRRDLIVLSYVSLSWVLPLCFALFRGIQDGR